MQTTLIPFFAAAHGSRLRLARGECALERVDGTRMQLPMQHMRRVVMLGRGSDRPSGRPSRRLVMRAERIAGRFGRTFGEYSDEANGADAEPLVASPAANP